MQYDLHVNEFLIYSHGICCDGCSKYNVRNVLRKRIRRWNVTIQLLGIKLAIREENHWTKIQLFFTGF